VSILREDNSPGAITGDVSQAQSDYKSAALLDDDIGASPIITSRVFEYTSLVGHDSLVVHNILETIAVITPSTDDHSMIASLCQHHNEEIGVLTMRKPHFLTRMMPFAAQQAASHQLCFTPARLPSFLLVWEATAMLMRTIHLIAPTGALQQHDGMYKHQKNRIWYSQ
jgi:hypothetical protein